MPPLASGHHDPNYPAYILSTVHSCIRRSDEKNLSGVRGMPGSDIEQRSYDVVCHTELKTQELIY